MNKIKQKFKPYYDEKKYSLKLEDFILFEMALMLVVHINEKADSNKGYVLFAKYHQIGKWNNNDSEDNFLMQNACICLKKFRSAKVWKDTLEKYEKSEFSGVRLFDIEDALIKKRDSDNLVYSSREDDYMNYIISYCKQKSVNYAGKDIYSYYNNNNNEKKIYVTLDEKDETEIGSIQTEAKPREKITIKIEDLMDAAAEMEKADPEDHCKTVLSNNFIKKVASERVILADKIEINDVTNIVGMVGAGKTTLLKAMVYILDKRGKKTVIVTDTVAEVFKLYKYFHALGCSCSPLIGKSDRVKYINQLLEEGAYYLDEEISKYLTPNCLIDGLDAGNENAISFGMEPCTKLEHGNKKYVCPYFDYCPGTVMQREAVDSNIVLTTVPGFGLSKIGKAQDIFLKYVLEEADVVFYDECDRVQKTLDELFIPAAKFNEFINNSANDCYRFMSNSNEDRLKNLDSMLYAELQAKSPTVLACVSNAVKAVRNSGSRGLLSNTFSAYTLLDDITEEISENARTAIYQLMDFDTPEKSTLYDVMFASCESIKTDRFDNLLIEWIKKKEPEIMLDDINEIDKKNPGKSNREIIKIRREVEKSNKKKIELQNKIRLIITLIYFDKYIMEIGHAFEAAKDITKEDNELVGFARSRFSEQQDYLPSALMGNIFGMKLVDKDDILLFRQYAYGRVLLTGLPHLRVNKEGKPTGPHVVLLSGSSYAKGSFEYHVNADVNYIIEAGQNVRDFIARTKFVELGLEERISGSPLDKRMEILKTVIDKCIPNILFELEKDGKILLVVNSYEQAYFVAERVNADLIKRGCEEKACSLVPDKSTDLDESDKNIRRGDLSKFDQKKARILVAPYNAIERGHNIVDENGHSALSSVFFLIRFMAVPDDIKDKYVKMNGYMAEKMNSYEGSNIYEKNRYVWQEAIRIWCRFNDSSKRRLDNLCDAEIKTDLVATMFVVILQIFGRLCRVTDSSKNPPTVYFVDGAFRKKPGTEEGFDTLNELYLYMKRMFSDNENSEIAKTLYEPFFTAYEREIRHD